MKRVGYLPDIFYSLSVEVGLSKVLALQYVLRHLNLGLLEVELGHSGVLHIDPAYDTGGCAVEAHFIDDVCDNTSGTLLDLQLLLVWTGLRGFVGGLVVIGVPKVDLVVLAGLLVGDGRKLNIDFYGLLLVEGVDYHAARVVVLQWDDYAVELKQQRCSNQQPDHINIWIAARWSSLYAIISWRWSGRREVLQTEPVLVPRGSREGWGAF